MGLRDVLTGMLHGPRGRPQPGAERAGGGMSPLMMALLALLAYKAFKGRGGPPEPEQYRYRDPYRDRVEARGAGGLGDILGGLFGGRRGGAYPPGAQGGFLGGAATGALLSAGLGKLIESFQQRGYGPAAQSWVSTGPNKEIAPNELANALGDDTIDELSRETGMGREDLLRGLSHDLPDFVDRLTPEGRLPTEDEASRMA